MGRGEQAHDPGAAGLSESVDSILAAMADPHRRRALELLSQRPYRAGELATALDLPPPALSRHLRMLKEAGLVAQTHPETDARVRIYALNDAAMTELKRWIASTEAQLAAQLSALATQVEKDA
jgi:DNA-binding transcriptional ArsR family regulator